MEVKDVLTRLTDLGLVHERSARSGHYKVYDPETGAWLFDVSASPSDPNWHFNIARNLRRIGLSLEVEKVKNRTSNRKPQAAVDLDALKRAQEAARAAGEREPQLEDLDDAPPTSPLWKRTVQQGLTDAAQTEVIENMMTRAEDSKLKFLRSRLVNFFAEKGTELEARARERAPNVRKGTGARAEFIRTAMEVGAQRKMRTWKSVDSGQQTLSYFMKNENTGMSHWTRRLIEATLDHFEGLKWGSVNGGEAVEDATVTAEDELDAEIVRQRDAADTGERISVDQLIAEVDLSFSFRDRYVEALLKMLESGKHSDEVVAMEVMPRLDKLLLGEDGK